MGHPSHPRGLGHPSNPVGFGQPGHPVGFGQPSHPGQPVGFGQPGQPVGLGQPGQPGHPVAICLYAVRLCSFVTSRSLGHLTKLYMWSKLLPIGQLQRYGLLNT